MKKVLYVLGAGLLAFAACTKSEDPSVVSFSAAVPVESDGIATFSVTTDYAGTEAVDIPVTFSGTAVLGTDYTVSSEKFVLGGASPVTTINVTPVVYGSKKDVTLTVGIPSGFKAGQYASSSWTLSEKVGYVTFVSKSAVLADDVAISLQLYDATGNGKTLSRDEVFTVTVNSKKSTAVEGTHFKFKNGKTLTVAQGESGGQIELEFVGDAPESGKDVVVLDIADNARYGAGQYTEVTVKIAGSAWSYFSGKWVIGAASDTDSPIYPTKAEMLSTWDGWGDSESTMTGYPEYNAEDSFSLDLDNAVFTPAFKSNFKNYFIGESGVTPAESMTFRDKNNSKVSLYLMELDNINRYFSSSESSEDKVGYVGLLMSDDMKELTLYLIDHDSKTFLTGLRAADAEWGAGLFYSTKPTCRDSGTWVSATFTKAE